METNPYTPSPSDYLKSISDGGELGNNSNNEEGNPYVGGQSPPSAPAPAMGPRYQAAVNASGMGGAARSVAPAVSAGLSAISPMIPAAASAVGSAVNAAKGGPNYARFQQYVNQYKGQGNKRDFSKDGPPENIDDLAARVHMRESTGNFNAASPYSTARGGFQYLHDTWGGHGGFDSADKAPPEVQYNKFITDMAGAIKHNNGSVPVGLLSHFEGEGATKKVLKNPSLLYQAPGTHNANETGYNRIKSILGAPTADAWVADHNTRLANAKNMMENVAGVNTGAPTSAPSQG